MHPATTAAAVTCVGTIRKSRAPFAVDVTDAEEPVLEDDDDVFGVATAVAGLYVTPLASAATWKTEPFPYS